MIWHLFLKPFYLLFKGWRDDRKLDEYDALGNKWEDTPTDYYDKWFR